MAEQYNFEEPKRNPLLRLGGNPVPFIFRPQEARDLPASISPLGTRVYSKLFFLPNSYTKNGVVTTFQGIDLGTVIMSVTQTKNIITTAIQGSNGTVKEYISDGDYVIQVSGVITSNVREVYPSNEVKNFIELCKVPEALEFNSEFIDRFGSFNAVITDYSLPQLEGFRDSQPFTLTMITDNPTELILLNEET